MKKICILQNSISYGGTDTFVINLCKGLMSDNYNVTVVLSINKDNIGDRLEELKSTGVRIVWTCSLSGVKAKFRHLLLIYKELRKEKYDVFQSNIDLFNGPNMLIAWLAGVPIRVCHSHNSQHQLELQKGRTLIVKMYQYIMRFLCYQFSNRRCGCSEKALDFLFGKKWKTDDKSKVIPNGIDLSKYKQKYNIDNIKKELNLKNKYNICTVGRISYQKNPEFLLEIFYELSKLRDDVDLVWCGTGELESNIKVKIKEYSLENRVHMLGVRDDIPNILRCSNMFLLPSRFEGLGIVLVEAQAANLLCVISNTVPSEVDCGLCVRASLNQYPNLWAKQIDTLFSKRDLYEINENKLNQYSIEHMVKLMEEVFE